MTFIWQAPVAPNKPTCVLGILLNSLQLSELECPTFRGSLEGDLQLVPLEMAPLEKVD